MKIAVIMGGIRFDSQKRILNGIIEKAKEDQADIYVFSCDVWSYSTTQFITGEMEIYKLPDFTNRYGDISYPEIAKKLFVNQKTVEYHISKALKALRAVLKDYLSFLIYLI